MREQRLDVARGLAILSVVAGHLVGGAGGRVIYLFHMPFFFLLSGYLHRPDPDGRGYFRRRSWVLLTPYVVYLSAFSLRPLGRLAVVAARHPSVESFGALAHKAGETVYGSAYLVGVTSIFWFVTCLYLTQLLFNVVVVRVREPGRLLGLAVALYAVGAASEWLPRRPSLPWAADVVPVAFFFYTVGFLWGGRVFRDSGKGALVAALAVAVSASALAAAGYDVSFDMKSGHYGWFAVSPLAAVAGAHVAAAVAGLLARAGAAATALGFAGVASLTVMYTHQAFHFFVFEAQCARHPWLMAAVLAALGSAAHAVFLRRAWTRAALLGSYGDILAVRDLARRWASRPWRVGARLRPGARSR